MTTTPTSRPRGRPSTRVLVVVIGALGLVVVAAGLLVPKLLPTNETTTDGLRIDPGAALLTSVGATRNLTAVVVAPGGAATAATAAWTSSHPEVVSVDATGVITAKAVGSSQIIATAAGMTSSPALVVVATPAPGVELIEDSAIVGAPTDKAADGSALPNDSYIVTLSGTAPAAGTLVVGTGEQPIAGRVVSTSSAGDATAVTLEVVPLPDLFVDLDISETIDLASAPVDIVPSVARLYDVKRDGNHFAFTPKPDFKSLAEQAAMRPAHGAQFAAAGTPVGTAPLPPFTECEVESDTVGGEGPRLLPFKLSEGPSFEITVNPSLDITWNQSNKQFVVRAAPEAKVTVGFTIDATFNATVTCKLELFIFRVPVAGALSVFLSGLIPVGAGFEFGGEVTLASAELSAPVEANATGSFGFACLEPAGCTLIKTWSGTTKPPEFKLPHLPTGSDLRFKPSVEAFAYLEADIGNPFLTTLKLEAMEVKLGSKYELDWAPRSVQIADTDYASEWTASVDLGGSIGADIDGIASRLGLGDILSIEFSNEVELGKSPSGSLDVSNVKLTAGETTSAKVTLDEASTLIAGQYHVNKVVLVRSSGGSLTELGSVTPTSGQKSFEISFTVPQLLKTSELFAFVQTKVPPGGLIDFELARPGGMGGGIVYWGVNTGIWSIAPDGTGQTNRVSSRFASHPKLSPDGRLVVYVDKTATDIADRIMVANADGSDPRIVTKAATPSGTSAVNFIAPSWSPDGKKIVFTYWDNNGTTINAGLGVVNVDGTGLKRLTNNTGGSLTSPQPSDLAPSWSPDGTRIVFTRQVAGERPAHLFTVNADGTGLRQLTTGDSRDVDPDWSPDGSKIVFTRMDFGGLTNTGVFVMNADGSGGRLILAGKVAVTPSWSPDGSKIAFCIQGGPVTIMNADGTGVTPLSSNPALRIDWGAG